MGNKGRIVSVLRWLRAEAILGFITTWPRPDGGNYCLTAHMNTPPPPLPQISSRASCAQAKCTTQTIRGIQSQSLVPMATATAGVIV